MTNPTTIKTHKIQNRINFILKMSSLKCELKCEYPRWECNFCKKSMCDKCAGERSYVEYMTDASTKRRVYICHEHIHKPIRTYDIFANAKEDSASEADCA